jgi:GDPmannose 4,6-dehydratase
MLQQKKPEDYVIATGEQHTVKEFVNEVAKNLKMEIVWKGRGLNEKGYCNKKLIIEIDKRYFRPLEVESLLGDASKARKKLGWKPKYKFKSLVEEMVLEDLKKFSS